MAEPLIDRADLCVTEGAPEAQLVLHCEPADASAIATDTRTVLPAVMLRVEATGSWRALHLAPDEWLLIGPADGASAMIERVEACPEPHSLVDVGERGLHIRIAGTAAAALINTGCPLDLADAAFPSGTCTRTLFGKASVLLEREPDCFRMHYARSFRDYVIEFARTAAEDLPAMWPV